MKGNQNRNGGAPRGGRKGSGGRPGGKGGRPQGQARGGRPQAQRQSPQRRKRPLGPGEVIFDLYPLEGIEWRDLKVGFGASRDEVKATFARDRRAGEPRERVDSDGYAMLEFFGRELVVGFDAEGRADLFEFVGGHKGKLHPRIAHIDLLHVDADSSLDLIASKIGALDDSGAPYEYVFQRASICLYRESSPDDFGDMVRDHLFSDRRERMEEELMAKRWATVGIGEKGFYSDPEE